MPPPPVGGSRCATTSVRRKGTGTCAVLLLLLLALLQLCPGSHGQTTVANGFPVRAAAYGHALCSLSQSSASLVSAEAQLQQVMADIDDGKEVVTNTTTQTAAMAAPNVSGTAWPTRRIGACSMPSHATHGYMLAVVCWHAYCQFEYGRKPLATSDILSRVGPGPHLREFLPSTCAPSAPTVALSTPIRARARML